MKRLAIILTAFAVCCAPAMAQFAPAVAGITVTANATVTSSDVLVNLNVSDKLLGKADSAASFEQAAKSFAAISAAAGSSATVKDNGSKSPAMTMGMPMTMNMGNMGGGVTESATVAVAPGDLQSVSARLTAAHFTIVSIAVVPRDPDALSAQALAAATKIARAKASAIAAADGRALGRLVNVTPSYTSIFKDMMSSMFSAGPLAAIMSQMQAGTAPVVSVSDGGSFTFEIAP
jgi:uncharacterized protein YggE